MYKNSTDNQTGTEHRRENQTFTGTKTNHFVNRNNLAGIKASIDTIQEKIDLASNHLCMDLPKINMEIYRTFHRAVETWDLLNSNGSTGKINSTLSYIENVLASVSSTIQLERKQYSATYATLEYVKERSDATIHVNGVQPSEMTKQPPQEKTAELIHGILKIQELQESIITDIDSCLHRDIKSLEDTLNTMILILKDLIERSNSTKGPLLRIMSRLQMHDIVKQDFITISAGLSMMQPLEDLAEVDKNAVEAILFWKKASRLSYNLIAQLISLTRNQGSILHTEINSIEETVTRIKEDKDNIADFLLMNEKWGSAFDMAISEISEIMGGVLSKIEDYTTMKADLKDLFSCVMPLGKELEQHQGPGENSAGARQLIQDFKEAIIVINENLVDIKTLLIESIQGIDIYSKRCGESILRFRSDIKDLLETLDVSDHILDELQAFSTWVSAVQAEIQDKSIHDKRKIETEELYELLYRLENPHSNTLMLEIYKDPDEGITFF